MVRVYIKITFGLLLYYSAACSPSSEQETRQEKVPVTYEEIEKTPFAGDANMTLLALEPLSEQNRSRFPLRIECSHSGPYLLSLNNQFQFTTSETQLTLPTKLSVGNYLVMSTVLDEEGNTLGKGPTGITRIAPPESSDPAMDPEKVHLLIHYVKALNKKVLIDYLVINNENENTHSVRIYTDDRYLLEQDKPTRILIAGLAQGEHTIRFELIDNQGQLSSGPFARLEKKIRMK